MPCLHRLFGFSRLLWSFALQLRGTVFLHSGLFILRGFHIFVLLHIGIAAQSKRTVDAGTDRTEPGTAQSAHQGTVCQLL